MSQAALGLRQPLQWISHPFWGLVSACRTYAIRQDQNASEGLYVAWTHNEDGRRIPKCLGLYQTLEKAEQACERHAS
jgi:hypothetical protein